MRLRKRFKKKINKQKVTIGDDINTHVNTKFGTLGQKKEQKARYQTGHGTSNHEQAPTNEHESAIEIGPCAGYICENKIGQSNDEQIAEQPGRGQTAKHAASNLFLNKLVKVRPNYGYTSAHAE